MKLLFKKNFIWILVSLMVTVAVMLLGFQFQLIARTDTILHHHFEECVHRSMYATAKTVEEREILAYIDQTLNNNTEASREAEALFKEQNTTYKSRYNALTGNNDTIYFPDRKQTFRWTEDTSIDAVIYNLNKGSQQDAQRLRSLFNLVAAQLINASSKQDISSRVDPILIRELLAEHFANHNIHDEFHFAIADKWLKNINYFNDTPFEITSDCYEQRLFPSDLNGMPYYLYVYFTSDKADYHMGLELAYPTMISTILLLIICIVSIIYIFKQRQFNQMKTDFVNNMTHELKTPVASISLASEMLNDPTVGKSETMLKHISGIIRNESKRLSFLVEKILNVSVLSKSGFEMSFEEENANKLLLSVANSFTLKINQKGGTLKTHLAAKNDLVEVDEMHFSNVIHNLMDNAIKYSSEAPTIICIDTYNEKNRLVITISDNGIGIRKEHQAHLFDQFYRAPTGNRHDVKGFGIGLYYVKQVITAHHGNISVESEPGVGTKFTITLPVITQ